MEMIRNPSLMQEMMRTHDRALSNLEVTELLKLNLLQMVQEKLKRNHSNYFALQIPCVHVTKVLRLSKFIRPVFLLREP